MFSRISIKNQNKTLTQKILIVLLILLNDWIAELKLPLGVSGPFQIPSGMKNFTFLNLAIRLRFAKCTDLNNFEF